MHEAFQRLSGILESILQSVNLCDVWTRNTGQRQLRLHCCRLTAIRRHMCSALEGGEGQLPQLHLLLHLSPSRAILLITRLGLMLTGAPPFVLVLPATVAVAPLIVSLLLAAPLVPTRRQRAATCNNARTIGTSCDCDCLKIAHQIYYQTLQQFRATHAATWWEVRAPATASSHCW